MRYNQLAKEKIENYIKNLNVKELEKIIIFSNKTLKVKKNSFESDNEFENDSDINDLMNEKFWNYSDLNKEEIEKIEKYTNIDYMEAMSQTIEQWDYYVRLSIVKEADTPKEALEILLQDSSKKIRELAAVRLWVEAPVKINKIKTDEKSELIINDKVESWESILIKEYKDKKSSEMNIILNQISHINNVIKKIFKKFYYYPDDINNIQSFNHFMASFFDSFNDISIQKKDSLIFTKKINELKENYIDNNKLNDIIWINFEEEINLLSDWLEKLLENIKK